MEGAVKQLLGEQHARGDRQRQQNEARPDQPEQQFFEREQRREQIQPTAEPACLRAVDGVQATLCSQHEDRVECR